jgi:ATP-dependent Clp protease ATP-binding subunit ClpA
VLYKEIKVGAREPKRRIRNELKIKLAKTILEEKIHEGDRVKVKYDASKKEVHFEKVTTGQRTEKRKAK